MSFNQLKQTNIPKIIHYVWLGEGKKNQTIEECMKSWKAFCPDFKIIEWNEEKIKNINNAFLKEAISSKYWAFASDYIRLYALYNFGGIYLDTDLELTASLDNFLHHNFFCGFEFEKNYPGTAILGSKKHDSLTRDLLLYYENRHFILNGKPDLTPNPIIFKKIFTNHNKSLTTANEFSTINIEENRIIYPSYFFSKAQKGHKNFSIHHFEGSWIPEQVRWRLHNTISSTLFKLGRFEIRKTKSGRFAEFPPKIEDAEKILASFTYKKRKIIYIILTKSNL